MADMEERLVEDMPNRIREWRQKRQLTLRGLGGLAGIAYGHLSRIEIGSSTLNDLWLTRLARALSVLPADLLPLAQGGLSSDERIVIDTLRELPGASRQIILAAIESQQQFRNKN